MRAVGAVALTLLAGPVGAQTPQPATREGQIEQQEAQKATELHPYVPSKGEQVMDWAETYLTTGVRFHPFFQSAYSGGSFTLGAGYKSYVSSYNTVDVRGSYTILGYKRIEAEFLAPRLFSRESQLSIVGGWREATQVGFYGIGMATSVDDRADYDFKQPYGVATLTVRPHHVVFLQGSFEASQWDQGPGQGNRQTVDDVYSPGTLPGLGAKITYLHSQGTVGIDTRAAPAYARRGGFYGVTFHDFTDRDSHFGFTQMDYEAIQHIPILREAWVLSFHGLVSTTGLKSGEEIPFFMLPAVGGGSSLRGFSSWRFRDRNSLLLQGEWRIMVNRFIDTALFYDTGKVTAHTSDLDLDGLKNDYGFGIRFHGPTATALRLDLARGNEGLSLVFAASAVF
jgi:hypothetical protein